MRNPKEARENWHPTAERRFWPKVDKDGPIPMVRPDLGQCWEWLGAKFENGYGAFRFFRGGTGRAHRYAYMLLVGDIPGDLVVDHLCERVTCVNPHHFQIVTDVQNVMRGVSPHAVNARRKLCIRGHELVPVHNNPRRRKCVQCAKMHSALHYERKKRAREARVGDAKVAA